MHKARSSYASYVSVNFVLTILFFEKQLNNSVYNGEHGHWFVTE